MFRETLDELVTLHGVGRKTAAVVSSNAFGRRDGIAVDTHVGRVSRRLGLTRHADPVKVERALMRLFPRERWLQVSDVLIFHGRRVCEARRPRCAECAVRGSVPVGASASCDASGTAAVLSRDGLPLHHRGMTRIEIELYADRLSRHAERLRDDLEGARMRLGWLRLESRAREQLGVRDCAVLEALGVLTSSDEAAERRLVDRRLRQLEVVERFQALVEAELEGLGS